MNHTEVNFLANTITIKQLSKSLRRSAKFGKRFIEDDELCREFIIIATGLGFTSNEAMLQINTERKYINEVLKNANRTPSQTAQR